MSETFDFGASLKPATVRPAQAAPEAAADFDWGNAPAAPPEPATASPRAGGKPIRAAEAWLTAGWGEDGTLIGLRAWASADLSAERRRRAKADASPFDVEIDFGGVVDRITDETTIRGDGITPDRAAGEAWRYLCRVWSFEDAAAASIAASAIDGLGWLAKQAERAKERGR